MRFLAFFLLFNFVCPALHAATPEKKHFSWVMGTDLWISVKADSKSVAIEAIETALGVIQSLEAQISTWKKESQFSEASNSDAYVLSPEIAEGLEVAASQSALSRGAFSPWVGPLVDAHQTRLPKAKRTTPNDHVLLRAVAASRSSCWKLDGQKISRLCAQARIEEGGFGKGWALDRAARALKNYAGVTAFELNLGGQIYRHRWVEGPVVLESGPKISLTQGSVSVTGNSVQGAHVIDPDTGQLIQRKALVAVVADTAILADIWSTACFVMGKQKCETAVKSVSGLKKVKWRGNAI